MQRQSFASRSTHRCLSRARLLMHVIPVVALSGTLLHAESFKELADRIGNTVDSQKETAIISLLQAATRDLQPARGAALGKQWLDKNLPKESVLLYHMGRNMELSGDWSAAVAFYEQFLADADPKSPETSDAITALHSLLIHQIQNPAALYDFCSRHGERLATNPRFRQYDRWFLNQARQRGDTTAVTKRLLATHRSGISKEQFILLHEDDLIWLTKAIRNSPQENPKQRFTKEQIDQTRELSKAIASQKELSLLLDWAISIKNYNMARIAGEEIDAPISEAKALLATQPSYAPMIQDDWIAGNLDGAKRGDIKKYWQHQSDRKIQVLVDALPSMTTGTQARLFDQWSPYHYASLPFISELSAKAARELATKIPNFMNSGFAPDFPYDLDKMTPADAQALAPLLKKTPHADAAVISAIATSGAGKDPQAIINTLLSQELWRLAARDLNSNLADKIWTWAGRPGGGPLRDKLIKQVQEAGSKIRDEKALAKLDDAKRLAEFKKLWQEFQSASPKTPGLVDQIESLLRITPAALTDLLGDSSPDAQAFTCLTLYGRISDAAGNSVGYDKFTDTFNPFEYNPMIQRLISRWNSVDELRKRSDLYKPHPLLPALESAMERQLKSGKVEAWLAFSWLNAQFPENNEKSTKIAQDLVKSPAWNTLPEEARHGVRSWFPEASLSPAESQLRQAALASHLCEPLIKLPKDADANTAADAIKRTNENLSKAPTAISVRGLDALAALSADTLKDPAVIRSLTDLIDNQRLTTTNEELGKQLLAYASKSKDPRFILLSATYLWLHTERYMRPHRDGMSLIAALAENQPESASAMSRIGLAVIDRHTKGHTWFDRSTDIPQLKNIRGKCAMSLGLVEIPVAPNHPSYPIYLSQAEWMTDNIDTAWKLLDSHWDTFQSIHRELSIGYLMWALQRSIDSRDDSRQEPLIKSLLTWSTEASSPLSPTDKAAIEIAYGDIAMQRGQLREAHEIFKRTSEKEAYAGLMIRHQATLRKARAERIAKDFDAALETLSELELARIQELWSDIRYASAEIHFDMEEFDDAKDDIDAILARTPNHADSKILLGKIQLKRQKLMEATEVELGSATSQQNLVPGETLKVTLTDPTLAVSGAGTEIEVVVWTSTGDRENFFLRQFGDQKTKFRGEVATALGKPSPNDGILQVIGDDEVYYAYSERFRQKMNNLDEKRGGPITIASDGLLMASARKLLSEEEQRRADMESVMNEIRDKVSGDLEGAAKAKLAAKALENQATGLSGDTIDFERHLSNTIKPGNPIHVRVVDPDSSRTADIDELRVSVATSSGDSISSVTLKETSSHSGWFEGSIPTTSATARAIAIDSEPGLNPNMVISANPSYPAWRPILTKGRTPDFMVDLNDIIGLGKFTLSAKEPGSALKKLIIQTAPNRTQWTTVATYPDGNVIPRNPAAPSITVVNEIGRNAHYGARSVYEIADLRSHLSHGWMAEPTMATCKNVKGPSEALPASIPTDVKWLRSGRWENPAVVACFKAWFHEPQKTQRQFKLELGNYNPAKGKTKGDAKQNSEKPEFLIAINGRVITTQGDPTLSGTINLDAGAHQIEIWATGWLGSIGFGRETKLLTRSDDLEDWQVCPDELFDPERFPKGSLPHLNRPAKLTTADNGTTFNLEFAPGSEARMIRLLLVDQEGSAPTLNKIALTNAKGESILPLKTDFAELNRNSTLEILTGDRISVRYLDDRFVTPTKKRQERFLSVNYTDATIEFADMEPRYDSRRDKKMPFYEALLRYNHDEPLSLAVHDADMDSTVEPDRIQVTLDNGSGTEKAFEAVETGDSTGVFKLVITPVTGTPTKPGEFQVPEGSTITASYVDHENNHPGVMTRRITRIEHASFSQPEMLVGNAIVEPWKPEPGTDPMQTLVHGFQPTFVTEEKDAKRTPTERVLPRWQIKHEFLSAQSPPQGGFQAVLGQPMYLELKAPQFALRKSSTITVYAQTESGRRLAGNATQPFDVNVPGTIALTGTLDTRSHVTGNWRATPPINIYRNQAPWGIFDQSYTDRFRVSVPLIAGVTPSYGVLSDEAREALTENQSDSRDAAKLLEASSRALVAKPGDTIHLGFEFKDASGQTRWITASTRVTTHPVFDVMNEEYHDPVTTAYAGEHLFLRVVDLGADTSDEIDTVQVVMQAKSGAQFRVPLSESGPHTGIFRDNVLLNYSKQAAANDQARDVIAEGFPITYGDTVATRYTDGNGNDTDTHYIAVSKGADGSIQPFSKTYEDEEIAMRTQFSLAEAYLEMAKRHRQLGETEKADIEYKSAKMLLSKTMDQFTDADTRANAEYLLGMLTMEEAIADANDEHRNTLYRAALSRFMNVTGSYPQTIHASRAQYRIATVYELLKEPDIAAQEYVKLAYKYPDSEFLATSMARLGTHFLKKAAAYENEAKPLLARAEEDKNAAFEGEALQKLAVQEYLKTANIFSRLLERFPSNELAGQAGLRAGQAFMRAGKKPEAVQAFNRVIQEESYDGPSIRAQALYWVGMCYQEMRQEMAAYSAFKNLTYDFPESEWAAYARAQLSQEGLLRLESKLELERLEAGQ